MASGKESSIVTFAASFLGAGLAEVVTLPIDITKIRLQVQNKTQVCSLAPQYTGMVDALLKITRQEGFFSLFKGGIPALIRQTSYTSLTMVIFPEIKKLVVKEGQDPGFFHRLFAGGAAGSISIAIVNPTEILKTRMQSSYVKESMRNVITDIYFTDGLVGFWAGVKPNIVRCFLVNAAEIGVYDHAKNSLIRNNVLTDWPIFQQVTASGIAGFASAIVSTPADVVKTRLMNQAGQAKLYRGMMHAFLTIPKAEGFIALYKGFAPILVRKIAWCTVFFVSFEKMKLFFS